MIVGVVLVNLISILGYMNRLTWIARPLILIGHLHPESGLSFITAFASPTAANTMLMDLYQKGIITKRELFIASMSNSFPAILVHWRSMLPVLIPLLGHVGVIYFLLLVFVGLIKTALVLIVGHFILPFQSVQLTLFKKEPKPPLPDAFKQSLQKSIPMFKRIIFITIPITIITFYLLHLHFFDYLSNWLSPILHFLPLPPEALSIIAAQFAGHLPAYTLASNLLVAHVLTGKEIILALLVGTVLTSITGLRYLIPYYWGIFGPKLGTQIMLVSQGLRQSIILLIAIGVYWWPFN
ncbi:MAG: nucleoside recognition protein [Candidatus Desulfofervidaceae bacterium]|nr:nucleoside recognition protein [Candidatus Desulfofervidaceae bacterium]MDL1970766.1 nucleoside recognition protein [Candidatus Desulfofervidaceae bacterium]